MTPTQLTTMTPILISVLFAQFFSITINVIPMDNLCEGGSAEDASTKKGVKLPHEPCHEQFYFKDTQIVLKVGEIAWFRQGPGSILTY